MHLLRILKHQDAEDRILKYSIHVHFARRRQLRYVYSL